MLFEISGLKGAATGVPGYVANTFAVLTRGAPTHPSTKLQNLLKNEQDNEPSDWETLSRKPLVLAGSSTKVWDHMRAAGAALSDSGQRPVWGSCYAALFVMVNVRNGPKAPAGRK